MTEGFVIDLSALGLPPLVIPPWEPPTECYGILPRVPWTLSKFERRPEISKGWHFVRDVASSYDLDAFTAAVRLIAPELIRPPLPPCAECGLVECDWPERVEES